MRMLDTIAGLENGADRTGQREQLAAPLHVVLSSALEHDCGAGQRKMARLSGCRPSHAVRCECPVGSKH
jgi:hypothetical protein